MPEAHARKTRPHRDEDPPVRARLHVVDTDLSRRGGDGERSPEGRAEWEPHPLRVTLREGERRTVRIGGQPTPARRRVPAADRVSSRPDRLVMWAVMLGLVLVLMATATARAGI